MRKNVLKVYDAFITFNTPVYTAPDFNNVLGAFDKMTVQAVVDNVGGDDPVISVMFQQSNDGRNWSVPEGGLDQESLDESDTNNFMFTNNGLTPAMALVRFQIVVGAPSGTPAGHVCITVCQRDDS